MRGLSYQKDSMKKATLGAVKAKGKEMVFRIKGTGVPILEY